MRAAAAATVRLAASDEEVLACFPVLSELRPHLERSEFVPRVREQGAQGYRLAYVDEGGDCAAVAGFRVQQNLAWGRFLYVDDLVTAAAARSRGHGALLLRWLEGHARDQGCAELHLDSGTQRKAAHRFYLRERMEISGFHFSKRL